MVTKNGWASHSPYFASPDYLCPLFTCCNCFWINKNKSRTNNPPPSPFHFSCSSSPRLWEHFSLGPVPFSPQESRDQLACPGMLQKLPRVAQSRTIYRAEALELLSSDGLVCSPGATPLGRGQVQREWWWGHQSRGVCSSVGLRAYRENCPSDVLDWHPWHIRLCLSSRSVREKH